MLWWTENLLPWQISCRVYNRISALNSLSLVPLTSGSSMVLYADLMTFYSATRRRAPCFPAESVTRYSKISEQFDSYHYLGVKNSPGLTSYDVKHKSKEIAWHAIERVLSMGRHSNTTEPIPYLCVSSFGVCLHSVGSVHLQEHLYAWVSQNVRMKGVFEMVGLRLWQHATLAWCHTALYTSVVSETSTLVQSI